MSLGLGLGLGGSLSHVLGSSWCKASRDDKDMDTCRQEKLARDVPSVAAAAGSAAFGSRR